MQCLQQDLGDLLPIGVTRVGFFLAICWGGRIRAREARKLNNLTKKSVSVLEYFLDSFYVGVERRTLNKLVSILDNVSHLLHVPRTVHLNLFFE